MGQQVAPPEELPVSGSCVVSLASNVFRRERCDLSTDGGSVPNGSLLVIQHVSAACSTAPNRGIFTLALITRTSVEGPMRTTHIPVAIQAVTPEQVRLVGAQNARIYAGSVTSVEALSSTFESAPPGHTGCDPSFTGVLKRINE